jgi:hypothetical protein
MGGTLFRYLRSVRFHNVMYVCLFVKVLDDEKENDKFFESMCDLKKDYYNEVLYFTA